MKSTINKQNPALLVTSAADSMLQSRYRQKYGFRDSLADDASYYLELDADRLTLISNKQPGQKFSIDFVTGKNAHRRRFGGGRKQPLARAVGIRPGHCPFVMDVTAGLGRDGFVLATLGCDMVWLERSPVMAALLDNALQQALASVETREIAERIMLVNQQSSVYLGSLSDAEKPDVIYMDPMYPHRKKSALVKKEMRILRDLVGDDDDSETLLESALATARFRVVVKRPRDADVIGTLKPDTTINSPNTRYDIYLKTG